MKTGLVYQIINKINNKSYIGQTTKTLDERVSQHIRNLQREDYPLCRAFRKYGVENFEWKILYSDIPIAYLDIMEIYIISQYKTFGPNGYNCSEGGKIGRGRIVSEETKYKISQTSKKRITSEETKKKLSASHKGQKHWNYGKKHSEATKRKIGEASKNRICSVATRKKISDAHKGAKHWTYGKPRSEEVKEKIVRTKGAKPFQVYKGIELIGEWKSQTQCAKDLNLRQSLINLALHKKHRQKTTGGYSFKFIESENFLVQEFLLQETKS